MRICIYGAGAVGGHIAVRLMLGGTPVSVIARGAHLEAIRERGLTLLRGERSDVVRPACTDDPETLGPQDLVVVATKTTSLPAVARGLPCLLDAHTLVVLAQNGIPWWFADGASPPVSQALVTRVDPDGAVRRAIPLDRTVAGVVYSGNEVIQPGVIRSSTPHRNRLLLGVPRGTAGSHLQEFAGRLSRSGYEATITPAIREEIWSKLVSVVAVSCVAALTGMNSLEICSDPGGRSVAAAMMRDVQRIGQALGLTAHFDINARLDPARNHPHRPSLLQDMEAGRPLELNSGILAVQAVARALGVDTPALDVVAALVAARASRRGRGLAPESEGSHFRFVE
ncbi:MAG: 2-dehydropantoate 2-reductase [Armatimonadetes bacterium]|nr:2-dehydropantoate 2-reductase [Armatimonadota bacterium]